MKRIIRHLLKILYPPKCIICKCYVKNEMNEICADCINTLPFKEGKTCPVCSIPVSFSYGDMTCHRCRYEKRYFDRAVSPFTYEGEIRSAVLNYKFYGKTFYAKTLAQFMYDEIKEQFGNTLPDVLTYVPLHPLRYISRGYNQSKMLADYIGEKLNIPVTRTLIKIKNTRPLSSQKHKNRHDAVKGVYQLYKNSPDILNGKTVLLIDDIITTGATISECSHILKRGGAKTVLAATVAQTTTD